MVLIQILEVLRVLYILTQNLCIHFVYKNCTRCIQLMYTKCTQNVYHIFWQAFVYILYTKLKELWQPNFVYKTYTKHFRNVGYILCKNISYTLCIHQFWPTKSVHHKNFVYNLYTKFIENVYTNNLMESGSHISTHFDLFIVHFLPS